MLCYTFPPRKNRAYSFTILLLAGHSDVCKRGRAHFVGGLARGVCTRARGQAPSQGMRGAAAKGRLWTSN